MIPSDLKYTEEHEWVAIDGDTATVGITGYAAEELGEIVFVDLPKIGTEVNQMDEFGSVESVKTVSSLYLPLTGKVVEVNESVLKDPSLISEAPYEDGWLVKISLSDEKEIDDLLTADEYESHLEAL